MPNGHSGGFPIDTADLKQLLSAVADTAPIGMLADGSSALRPADAAKVLQLVEAFPKERLAVEEQDYSFYIIHIRDEPTALWVSVRADSPVFAGLKQQHAQWKLHHPT
jgi:hypothetical protein